MTDRDTAAPGFDPRFNPAFQPGYDPAVHGASRPEPVRPHEAAEVRAEPPIVLSAAPAPAESTDAPTVAHAVVADEAAPAVELAPAPRPNPLIVALWVLSLLFVVTGAYGLRYIDQRVTALSTAGGFGNSDYYLLQAYATGAPMLIVLGLATATGTLFFYAARWRRSR